MLELNWDIFIGLDNYTTIIDRARQNAFVDITDKLQNEYNLLREEANISNNKEIEKKLFDIHEKIKTIRVKNY